MKTLINIITSIVILTCTCSAYAEETGKENKRQYDIEIIIFEDAHARYLESETWPVFDSDATSDNETGVNKSKTSSIRSGQSSTGNQDFTSIKPEILTQQYKSLKRSSEFKVLFRSSWRQVGLAKGDAFEIDIEDLTNTHLSKSKNAVTGKVKVVLARYLHFYSDLDYQRHIEPGSKTKDSKTNHTEANDNKIGENQTVEAESVEAGAVIENNIYPMQSHRRMRSKELHYIDHPLLGILIQINPVEITVKPEEVESDINNI